MIHTRNRKEFTMRRRRPFSQRAGIALAPWMPLDGKQLALLTLVALGVLALGAFLH
jgi:hypothetical protein